MIMIYYYSKEFCLLHKYFACMYVNRNAKSNFWTKRKNKESLEFINECLFDEFKKIVN